MIQEMLYARRASRDMMLWHARVLMEDPGLHGRSLYQRVLIRRNIVDAMAADRILRRAEQSQGNWESDRDLRYQDVVLYVIVEEYLRRHPSRLGARANMERVVARNVARHL